MDSQLPLVKKGRKGMADFRSKRLKSIKLKSAIVCFLSLSTLMASGVATFAWFTTNKRATASYLNIVSQDTSLVKEVNYYNIKSVDSTNKTYTFSTESNRVYDMPRYDRDFSSGANQLLIEVVLKETTSTFTLKSIANKELFSRKTWADYNVDWDTNDKDHKFPLSAIIEFEYFTSAAEDTTNKTITVTEANDQSVFKFATLDGTAVNYEKALTLGTSQTGFKKIYIMLDYNEETIESIYSYNIGKSAFDGDFSSDSSSGSSTSGILWGVDFSIVLNPQ